MERTEEWAMVDSDTKHVTWIGPAPDSVVNPDGSTTMTPIDTPTDPKLLLAAGYLPVYDDGLQEPPEGKDYDNFGYEVKKNRVVRTRTFKDKPPDAYAEIANSINDLHERLAQDSEDRRSERDAAAQALSDAKGIMAQFSVMVEEVRTRMREEIHAEIQHLPDRLADVEARLAQIIREKK